MSDVQPIGTPHTTGQEQVSLILASWGASAFVSWKAPILPSKFSSDVTSDKHPKVRNREKCRLREREGKVEVFREREKELEARGAGTERKAEQDTEAAQANKVSLGLKATMTRP